MKYINEIFLSNVEGLRNEQQMKIGELEKNLEVSAGYFSRLAKNPEALPSVDLIIKISNFFNVSIDALLLLDIGAMGNDDKRILNILRMIHKKTANGMMEWKPIDNNQSVFYYYSLLPENNFFKYNTKAWYDGIPLCSNFYDNVQIELQPIKIDNQGVLLLCYELYMIAEGNKIPLCSSEMVQPLLRVKVKEIVFLIRKTFSDNKFTDAERNLIDKVLENADHGNNPYNHQR